MIALALALLAAGAACADEPMLDARQAEFVNKLIDQARRSGEPKDPLWKGLPPEIARDYPESEGFVRFTHVDGDVAPFGGRIKISPPDLKVTDVFEDESFARLPDGATIRRDASGPREIWDYPVGTRVLHRFYFKTEPRTLFELRLVQKLPDGKWAFGIYTADGAGERLPLHREGSPALAYEVLIRGRQVHVDMLRMSPSSCRACHFHMGHGGYQYPDQERVGPCGFSPPNPHLLTDWARDYRARHGAEPFAGPAVARH